MARVNGRLAVLLIWTALAAACGDASQAQTSQSTQAQIRENLGPAPAVIDTTTAYRLSAAFRGAAERALPAVVRVSVVTEPRQVASARGQRMPLERLFGFPGPDDGDEYGGRGGRGTGSGFVFDARGYILTNHHVVEGADRVLVTMVDGREYKAVVVGSDPQTDVAVIKIEPGRGEKLQPAEFGSSDNTHVGDWVIALGNPLNLQFTVTAGIVSAKGRSLGILDRNRGASASTGLEAYIQTDAVINPGNSGGPMIDLTGKVVGINSAIESQTGFWAGNGFAIPIDLARKVADDIIAVGHVRRPRLGVTVGSITAADAEVYRLPSVSGAEITSVQPGLAADRAGIQMGDVVVQIDNIPVRTQTEFMEELARLQPGQKVRLGIMRYGQRVERTVELGAFETPPTARAARPPKPKSQELLGFAVQPITPQIVARLDAGLSSGVYVSDVDPYSGAAEAVATGMVLRKINGKEVRTPEDVERVAATLQPGQVVSLVVRAGAEYDTIVNYRVR